MNKQQFINAIKNGAIEGYKKYKILPSLTMAQAILESGWGNHHIQNNLFGIKAGSSWKGKVAIKETREFINNKWVTVQAKFRAYNNFNDSVEDYARLLGENPRYGRITLTEDYRTACLEVWKAGYATDPDYPKKLMQIIEQNNLTRLDKEVIGLKTVRNGSRGEDVKRLQSILNNFGINVGNADGIFGAGTEKGAKEFQGIFGLVVDGIIGPKSWDILSKLETVKNFKVGEFKCKHCGQVKLDIDLLLKLEELRAKTGPLIINSGYRCPTHNKNVGGAKNSQHVKGTAADVRATKMSVNNVYNHANRIFSNGGVGKYNTFTHVDVRGYRSRW